MERHPLSPITEAAGSFASGPEHANSLGMRFYYVPSEARVECEWTPTDKVQGWVGLAHGGAFAALHDDAAAFAMVLLACRTGFTTKMDIRFLKPMRLGQPITATGKVQELSERRGTFVTEIASKAGDLLSTALTEYAFVDGKTLERLLGRPLSEPMKKWIGSDDAGRRAYAIEWGRTHGPAASREP